MRSRDDVPRPENENRPMRYLASYTEAEVVRFGQETRQLATDLMEGSCGKACDGASEQRGADDRADSEVIQDTLHMSCTRDCEEYEGVDTEVGRPSETMKQKKYSRL